jgi:ABC-type multidrug transport system fused ATPase/permease subunit
MKDLPMFALKPFAECINIQDFSTSSMGTCKLLFNMRCVENVEIMRFHQENDAMQFLGMRKSDDVSFYCADMNKMQVSVSADDSVTFHSAPLEMKPGVFKLIGCSATLMAWAHTLCTPESQYVSQSPLQSLVSDSVTDCESAQSEKTTVPRNPLIRMLKRVTDRYPSLLIWKKPWKNPLIVFPISFYFSTLNAASLYLLCFQPSNWNEPPCQKSYVPCLSDSACGQPATSFSFWLAEPQYHASASDLPCSVFSNGALSLSSKFPSTSYKYAANTSHGLTTLAVCTNASIQEFQTSFQEYVTSSVLFTSKLMNGRALIVLPNVGSANTFTDFDPNAPYKISDIFSEFKLDRYNPTDPSRYSACCANEFCKTQLNSCDSKQPYKFVWGAIPAITSTAPTKDCRSLMGCEGSLSMIPTPGSAICSSNVYVVQATVSVSWLFRLLFLFFLAVDLFLVIAMVISLLRWKFQIKYPVTLELFHELSRMPIEFCEQIQSGGNLDRYMRCNVEASHQLVSDSLEMNAVTSSFGEFYNLLNQKELFDKKDLIEQIRMYKSTAFGNETGTFDMILPGPQRVVVTFPKHWKSAASKMPFATVGILIYCIIAKILVEIVYPSILLSTSPCTSYQQIYSIFVICKAVISLSNNLFKAFQNTFGISKQLQKE